MTKRKAIEIDDALWKSAKKEAKKQGLLFRVFIARLIKEALDATSNKARVVGK